MGSKPRTCVIGADITSELSRKGVAERVFISTRSGAWVIPKYVFGRLADQLTKTNPHIPLAWQRRLARLLPLIASGRPERRRAAARRPALSGRTVLITGAANGIGAATAERLHSRGANVALLDLDAGRLEALADELGDRAAWFRTDVSDVEALERAVEGTVGRFGGIDIAIANAGVGHVGTLAGCPPEQIERTIRINLLGSWCTDRAVLDQIVARRGYLLNIASLAAATHTAANGAYAASKAGIEALTDALRIELAPSGAAVGCAYFGYIDTQLERESVTNPTIQAIQRMMPGFVRRAAPVSTAVDAIEDGIMNRRARVWAPRYVGAALALRGVLQPLSEWRARHDENLSEQLVELQRNPNAAHRANG